MLRSIQPWKSPANSSYDAISEVVMAMVEMKAIEGFRDSKGLLRAPRQLRERAAEDGYLFFQGLLPRADVLRFRSLVLSHCQREGWLDPDQPRIDGITPAGLTPVIEGQEGWRPFYNLLYTRRELHAFNQHPRLMKACSVLFGGPVLAHARPIVRVMFPGVSRYTTPPHQDFFYIGGTPNTWTAWVPLGDCPIELGGLAIVPGSHHQGALPVHSADGAGGHAVEVDSQYGWAHQAYQAGDVVFFHSHTIHQGRDNLTSNRLRLSCDFRFQSLADPVRGDSLSPHVGIETWENIYASWPEDDALRYYWEKLPLTMSE
jgi:hypothetical protein